MTDHVVSGLQRKRSEIAQLVVALEQDLTRARIALAHVDATLLLFEDARGTSTASLPAESIATDAALGLLPVLPGPQDIVSSGRPGRPRGQLSKAVLDVLREAGEPLAVRSVTERTARYLRQRGSPPTDWKRFSSGINAILYRQRSLGVLASEIGTGGITLWRCA